MIGNSSLAPSLCFPHAQSLSAGRLGGPLDLDLF